LSQRPLDKQIVNLNPQGKKFLRQLPASRREDERGSLLAVVSRIASLSDTVEAGVVWMEGY
jgi:hypothetical protein